MNGTLVNRHDLSADTRCDMYELLCKHFKGVSLEQFDQDLRDKNWIVLLYEDDRLLGFSTFHYYHTMFENVPMNVVFSGDTIMDRSAWNSPILPRTWIESVLQVHESHGSGPLYWLLITSGYRTYRFLPVFWQRFFPCHHTSMPVHDRELLTFLAKERFGDNFDPQTGIVRFDNPQVLCSSLRLIPEGKRNDPHITFFERMNSNWHAGDELVCLTQIEKPNLTRAGERMVYGYQKVGL